MGLLHTVLLPSASGAAENLCKGWFGKEGKTVFYHTPSMRLLTCQ